MTKSQNEDTVSQSKLLDVVTNKSLGWHSIGSKLFLLVFISSLVGLGSMSYFFYQALEKRAKEQITSNLTTNTRLIEGKLGRAEQTMLDIVSAAKTFQKMDVQEPDAYKQLILSVLEKRTPLTVGAGIGQAPFQILPEREFFWPYFYVDQNIDGQVGQTLPPPYDKFRETDVCELESDCHQNNYYTEPVKAGKAIWLEPYEWFGITMTTTTSPILSDSQELIGVVGLDVTVEDLTEVVKEIPLSWGDGYFTILSEQGNLLAYPPDPQKARELSTYKDIPELAAVWEKIGTSESGLISFKGNYWAYQRIQGANWLMLAAVPQSVVLIPVLSIAVGGAIGAASILALVIILFVRKLNQRLQPILEECNKLSQTDGQTQAQMAKQDEIGRLSTSFFNLLEQLAVNEEKMRQEVARTVQAQEQLKQAANSQAESDALQTEVGHILEIVSAVEEGDLTVQAQVSDRATGLVADTLNRLIEELAVVLAGVLGTAQKVSAGVSNLEQIASDVATNADQQAQSVTQVLNLSDRVEQSAQDSTEQIKTTNKSLFVLSKGVEQGQKTLATLTEEIKVLQEGTDRIIQQMKTLGEFVGLADQFVQDQNEVVSRTQVLAMNAALVAARASEQKDPQKFTIVARDFEAIAEQVSKLAQQTNDSLAVLEQRTNQIHNVVSAIDADVQNLGGLVGSFTRGAKKSDRVFQNVQIVTEEVISAGNAVAQSSQEIVTAARLTGEAMRNIAHLADQTTQLTQKARSQSQQMGNLSEQLLQNIQFFRLPAQAIERVDLSQENINIVTKTVAAEVTEIKK